MTTSSTTTALNLHLTGKKHGFRKDMPIQFSPTFPVDDNTIDEDKKPEINHRASKLSSL